MKQTSAQALGRKGERWFQNAVPSTWIFQRPTEDFGIDGTVAIGCGEAVSAMEFGVQIKSSRNWARKAGCIQVGGIPTRTLTYWMARLIPTLLVLYDEASDTGYHAWIPDVLPDMPVDLMLKKKFVTLSVPDESVLNHEAWDRIAAWVEREHRRLIEALSSSAVAGPLLDTIHELASSLRLLQVLESAQPDDDDGRMLRDASDVIAHKSVYIALRRLARSLGADAPLKAQLEKAAAAYAAEVEVFITSASAAFERAFQEDCTMALWSNQPLMEASRPKMMFLICDYLCKLSGLSRRPQ